MERARIVPSLPGPAVALAAVVGAVAAVYVPSVLSIGFIRDDFVWIRTSHVQSARDLWALVTGNVGFYRPVVAVSFAVNRLAGLEPVWYATVNFLLLFACMAALLSLLHRLGMPGGAAVFGAGLWALNFHGINMAVLWISGRTALWLCLFALLAARAAVSHRWIMLAVWLMLALCSKEEAFVLPLVLAAWLILLGPPAEWSRRQMIAAAFALAIPVGVYLALRIASGAMTPTTAPWWYQFTTDAWLLGRNVREYADRACTLPAVTVLCVVAATRRIPSLTPVERRWAASGIVWLVGGYALTAWLPLRSSLYACFPSIGSTIVAAAIATAAWRDALPRWRLGLAWGALLLPFALWPLYHARNSSPVAAGRLSRSIVMELRSLDLPPDSLVIVSDAPDEWPNFASTFGGHLPEALAIFEVPGTLCVEPETDCSPRRAAAHAGVPASVRFLVRHGRLQRLTVPDR